MGLVWGCAPPAVGGSSRHFVNCYFKRGVGDIAIICFKLTLSFEIAGADPGWVDGVASHPPLLILLCRVVWETSNNIIYIFYYL
jgi:hypothetical protein